MVKNFRISLDAVTPNNINQLKKLNSVLFPVAYSSKFYKDLFKNEELVKFAYFNDVPVGAVCCRIDEHCEEETTISSCYIMTLGVLSPYRRHGLGQLMLDHILRHCNELQASFVELHVQTNNDGARLFYEKSGFQVVATVEGYYSTSLPSSAWILRVQLSSLNN